MHSGGKAHALVVQTDAEWQASQRQLRTVKMSVNTVQVIFNLDGMSPWARLKQVCFRTNFSIVHCS